jgi:Cof subfamily protein (haloacid dehalogenase superfamily)
LSAYKINLLSFRKNKISKAITFLKNKYKNKLTFSYSHKRLIEINFKDVNKGFGVKYVADQLKIDHQQIAVLGDSNNDLPMFDVANLKIAIKPLSDSLKLKSTYCLDYKKNAVSDAINKYIINNNEILLVASDLDGTLLKDDTKEIDKQAKEMIVQLIDKYNKKFVICTGRSLDNAMLIANYLNVKNQQNLFSIGANGGCIYDVFHQRFIYKKLIDKKVAKQIIDIFLDFQNNKKPLKQIAIEAFTDDDPKNLAKNKIPKHYSINQKFVHDYYAIKHPGMTKNFWINREHEPIDEKTPLDQIMKFVLFFESSEDKARAFALFEKYNNLYEVSSSAKHNLEIMPLNISKGNALQRLCNYLDIDVKNTMTIGDEKNDISMLALSPHSVTLKSSSESVRKAATYVLDAPPSLVVAKAIKSYVLGNKND